MSDSAANSSLTIQLYDKFALLDGTIDGKGELDYEIPAGTSVYEALRQLLKLPKNKKNEPYDVKDIIFPLQYKNALLAYTIKKTSENSIGDLIKEIAQSIACDVGYNAYGNLEIEDSIGELDYHNQSIIWNYDEYKGEYANPSMDIKYSQIKNKVIVVALEDMVANISVLVHQAEVWAQKAKDYVADGKVYKFDIDFEEFTEI